jgi:hypothetical protein
MVVALRRGRRIVCLNQIALSQSTVPVATILAFQDVVECLPPILVKKSAFRAAFFTRWRAIQS